MKITKGVKMDKAWESNEISLWVNNDEALYGLARKSRSPKQFLQVLAEFQVSEIGGIKLTLENIEESWNDAHAE